MFELTNLRKLHNEMKKVGDKRAKFQVIYNNHQLDIIFFTDSPIYELLIGVHGTRFSLIIPVQVGYKIETYLSPDDYRRLHDALEINTNNLGPFKTTNFFEHINRNTLITYGQSNKVKAIHVAQYKKVVEEADRLYYCGWFDNSKVNKRVRPENLQKTKDLLGYDIYEFCKEKNISSCWTDDQERERPVHLP